MVKTSVIHLAKRVPMIKFRHGLQGRESSKNLSTSESYSSPVASATSIPRTSSGSAIEDWQLPARYQRKPIDKYEMEFINRGGPE